MDGKPNSNDSESLDSEIAGNSDPVPKSSSSTKGRSKSRSKVWEKVVWFTRKNRNGKEKASSSEDTRKSQRSSTLKLRKREDFACCSSDSSLCTTPNTKAKSGIKKAKSFNYLRRKKLKRSDSRHINPAVVNEDTKENIDPAIGNQTATGTFHDFVSCRSSRALTSSENLVSEMAKEMSCKQGEQTLENIESSLSSMSVSERSVWNATGQSSHSHCERRSGKFSGPTYNSWPRKKRLLLANQSYEAFSPPQKQKKTCSLRKTATFSGFDSSKLSVNEMKTSRIRLCGVKSTPLLPGRKQIKNQNGLTIGVIHFFKSQSNQCSSFAPGYDTSDLSRIRNPVMLNEEKQRVLHVKSSVDHTTDVVEGIGDIQNNTCPDSQVSSTSSYEEPSSPKSNLDKNEIIGEKQARFQKGNPSSDLHITEGCNIGTTLSSNEFFAVESQNNQICDLECPSPGSLSEDNGVQATLLEHTFQEIIVTLPDQVPGANFNWESKTRTNDITEKADNLALDREVYSQLDIIDEVSGYSSDMNTDTKISELPEDYRCKNNNTRKSTATDIYCIKIEDQAIDFAKESSSDLNSEPQPMLITPFVDTIETTDQQTNDNDSEKTKSLMHSSCTEIGGSNDIGTKELENDILSEACTCTENTDPCNQTENGVQIGCLQENKLLDVHVEKRKIGGPQYKQQTETVLKWFLEFNDEQRNILIRRLTEHCELPQMHLLSVLMEPILHKTCPSNCQDMLVWLPHTVTETVMSYLDPVSLCHCSQVNELWNSLASKPLIWRKLCRNSEWQLSRNADQIQCVKYTLPCGTIQWKKMFAERFLLRRNWLNGKCNVRTFEGHTQGISCVQFDDTRIVSGSTDKTIRVWDLSRVDSHAVLTLAGHSGTVRCLNLNRNRLVSGSVDRSIKVWDLSFKSYWSGASCKVTMVGHMHTVRCLQVDDHKVVSGSYDKTLKVWDLKTGLCKLTLRGHNAAVLCVQFDDSKIVSGSYDNTIKVWSLQEGECLMTLTGHHDAVTCLNLTQNGRKVISGSLDHNLKFWDLATGKCIGTLDWIRSEGHTGVIRCLQSDSWRIVSAGDDKTLKMWSLETGQRLLTLRCHTDGVTCLQFNDYTIVSGSYDKTVKVWNFSPEHDFLNPT